MNLKLKKVEVTQAHLLELLKGKHELPDDVTIQQAWGGLDGRYHMILSSITFPETKLTEKIPRDIYGEDL